MPETKTRVRKKLFPSTQLLMTTVFLEVATVCLLVLSWAPIGSFETALALFLVANVLGIITASIAFICAWSGFLNLPGTVLSILFWRWCRSLLTLSL